MQSRTAFLASILACSLLSGCAGVSPTRVIGNTVGAAGGALLGHTFGKGNPLATTLGAGAGVLFSETLQAGSSAAQQRSYVSGYEKGQSDTAKRQFQALNERQRIAPQSDEAAAQVATQDIENRADRERQEQARREERQAQMEEGFRRYSETFQIDTSAPAFPARR